MGGFLWHNIGQLGGPIFRLLQKREIVPKIPVELWQHPDASIITLCKHMLQVVELISRSRHHKICGVELPNQLLQVLTDHV